VTTEQYDIVVEDLTKRYGAVEAVRGISFKVRKGEVFGILGPNGAGKTTTLECIEGLQRLSSGAMTVLGMDVPRETEAIKERIGVQLQASSYFDYLTLSEILDLFGHFYKRSLPVAQLLQHVGLEEKARVPVSKLSGGQKQRFTIASTLINDPELIFLDEPTTGLDPKARRDLWDLIRAMNKEGRTIILTTHYMEEAQVLCNRVAIMDQGKIVALDTPTRLIQSLPAPYEVHFAVEGTPAVDGFQSLDAVTSVLHLPDGHYAVRCTDAARTLPALLSWAKGAGVQLARIEVRPATLEDVFLALTGHELPE
jgi:ABC-2 type transport system ATP-binding protein